MLFTFVICHLIFCIEFSLEDKPGDGQDETNELDSFIKKPQLNKTIVKNYIEEFENQYAAFFVPNWTELETVDMLESPVLQNMCIRRRKWEYILSKANVTIFAELLNSELKKFNIDHTTFCNEIAETYIGLATTNYFLCKKSSYSKKTRVGSQICGDPLQRRSILAFLRAIYNLRLNLDDSKETVQVPKSIYLEFVKKDAHKLNEIEKLKRHHEDRVKRLKNACKYKFRELRIAWGSQERLEIDSSINLDY